MSGDGKTTVVERPPSSQPDADEVRTAHERPPSAPHATSTPDPADAPPRRSSRRAVSSGTRYENGEEIGRGGMGRVVEATDTLLDRRVAVKAALTTDPELLRRFARETKITARLEHPSIVPVYDAGVVDGSPFYVMRRVTGRPLSELIRAAPTLEERLALVPHLLAAAQAIAHAHQRGIIHRDIKPANILVGELGETVVIDWGLAKVIGESDDDTESDVKEPGASTSLRTRLGAVFGTPGFMDPNQLRGDAVGPQGDVYSLGASLYNLLAATPPHYANDSTQMMKLASLGPPTPISQVVAGVPAELSTIVDTATEYDLTRRYRDAGAFAEELKQFLAGQLVASHRYSTSERFLRFLRKHRAAVAIGSAATVLVIVIGTFAISQVLEERDRADEQARLATQGRREAEAARAMADERADQLLLSRANALVETNPTAAVASLKQLSPKSKRIPEALAIATAARMRGVAWAMKADDHQPTVTALDPSATLFAVMTVDGKLHVYDLEARRLQFEVQLERGIKIRWILDGTLLLAGGLGPTRAFTRTGVEQKTDVPAFDQIEIDERGVVLIVTDTAGKAMRIDLEKKTRVPLASRANGVAVTADGTHCAVLTDNDFIVYDHVGAVVLHRAHRRTITRHTLSKSKVAVIDAGRVLQAPLEPNGTWVELAPSSKDPNTFVYWMEYAEERLFVTFTNARVLADYGGTLREIGRMHATSGTMHSFGHDYLTVGADGRRIYFVDGTTMRTLYLPIALRFVRLASRRAHTRIVAIGDGAIVVVELATLPTRLPIERYHTTAFANERTLVSFNAFNFHYAWYDLVAQRSRIISSNDLAEIHSFDRRVNRALIVETRPDGGHRASVLDIDDGKVFDTVDVAFNRIQLIGDGIVYSIGNRVFGGLGSTRKQLFTTNGVVEVVVRLNESRFAAVGDDELVRGDLATGAIERVPLPSGPPIPYATSHHGEVLFARGDRVFLWGTTLRELAKLESTVEVVHSTPTGILALLANHSTFFVAADGTATRLAATRGPVLVSEARAIVSGQFQYDVIELPSLARWSLPITRTTDLSAMQIDLSPGGTQVVEKGSDGRFWLWKLPVTDQLSTALEATNLLEDQNGLLMWPWQ